MLGNDYNQECRRDLGETLNFAVAGVRALDRLFDLQYPCKCEDLVRELLRDTIIAFSKVRDGSQRLIHDGCYRDEIYTLFAIHYGAEEVVYIIEAILDECLCTEDKDGCHIVYALREVYLIACEVTTALALLFGKSNEEGENYVR